jgi:hypothetical protein
MKQVLAKSGDMVYSDGNTIGTASEGDEPRYVYPEPDGDPLLFLMKTNLATPSPLHWKEHLVAVGGFRTDLVCAQEYDLHLRLACRGLSLRHVPEQLFSVRRVRDSVSSNYSRVLQQYPIILGPIYEKLQAGGGLNEERKKAFAETMARAARHCIRVGSAENGLRFFEQARRMHPDGGLGVYRRPARLLRHFLGPVLTERIVMFVRRHRKTTREQPGRS